MSKILLQLQKEWSGKSKFIGTASSFTLVELLVVIGILAVLTAAVILIINPVEYLRQARDVTRMSDLDSINKTLSVLETQGITSFGTTNTVYISIADNASSTCGSLGLPALPSGWSYACVSSTNLQKTDGNGWIPVNFTQSTALAFSNLPLDPVNTTSTGNYYTYIPGGSWELTTAFESSKYKLGGSNDLVSKDGGLYAELYEIGSDKKLTPINYGDLLLVALFDFIQGQDSSALYNKSGQNYPGYLELSPSNPTWTSQGLYFDGTNDYAYIAPAPTQIDNITYDVVFSPTSMGAIYQVGQTDGGGNGFDLMWESDSASAVSLDCCETALISSQTIPAGSYADVTFRRSDGFSELFVNGVKQSANSSGSINIPLAGTRIGMLRGWRFFKGTISLMSIYNRALSDSEITGLYRSNKNNLSNRGVSLP